MLLNMLPNRNTPQAGYDLRAAREAAGISRARLAALADCSPAMIEIIEAGAVPKRSAVLARCRLALQDAGGCR